MINRGLRYTRIAVSTAVFIVLAAALTVPSLTIPVVAPWLCRIQIVPALMAYSLFTFVVWMIVTLTFGRIYCSSVCPLGTLQDIASRSVRFHKRSRIRRPYRFTRARPALRWLFIVVMLLSLVLQNVVAVTILDPYGDFAGVCSRILAPAFGEPSHPWILGAVPGTLLAIALFAAVVTVAARSGRTVCNTVCPVGSTLGLVSRYAIFQIDIDTDKCINCGLCEEACKGSCIDLTAHVVDSSRCVNCFDCLPVCPNDAIHYTNRRKQLSIPMMQELPGTLKPKKPELGTSLNTVKSPEK